MRVSAAKIFLSLKVRSFYFACWSKNFTLPLNILRALWSVTGNTHQFDLFPQISAVLEIQDSGRDRLLMRDTYQVLSNREIPDMIKWQMSTVR